VPDKETKKILLVGPYPPPYGGIASIITNMLDPLVNNGYSVYILSFNEREEVIQPKKNVTIIRLNLKKQIKMFYQFKYWGLTIRSLIAGLQQGLSLKETVKSVVSLIVTSRIIKENDIRLIAAYHTESVYYFKQIKKTFKNLAIYLTVFAELYTSNNLSQRKKRFIRESLSICDKVLATSYYCAGAVEQVGFNPKNVQVIYAGIDIKKYSPTVDGGNIRLAINIPNNKKLILFVGRFIREMGLDMVLVVIPILLRKRDDVVFMLIGAHGELDLPAREVQGKYPDKVFIYNDVNYSELPGYYAAADFLVAPSQDKRACMGLAIKEAMAMGKPTIGSATGGIPEAIVAGETGLLVPVDNDLKINKQKFIEAIECLLNNPELAEAMGKKARERAERLFSDEVTYRIITNTFNDLLAKYPGEGL